METMFYKTQTSASDIMRKLDQSRKHLRSGNLFSCISIFHEALYSYINIKGIIESDRVKVIGALNDFQRQIAGSQQFKDLYGVFSFRMNDFSTSFEFITQLIKIKEEEIAEVLVNKEVNYILNHASLSKADQETVKTMVSLVERGEQEPLRKLVAENDSLAYMVMAYYNETGISNRTSGDIDKAIIEYKKGLSVSPDDENIYYNLARAYFEQGKKDEAEECVNMSLKLNPEFREGLKLRQYISKWAFDQLA